MAAILAFTQDPTEPHFHQCGRITDGWVPGFGCHHLWQHSGPKTKDSAEYAQRHMCPACGKGPWFYVLSAEELESAHCIMR